MPEKSSDRHIVVNSITIKLSGLESSLGVKENVWRLALSEATPDPIANIKHAKLNGTAEWRIHVAEIPEKVACHVHFFGNEVYEVLEGEGILHYGSVEQKKLHFVVNWNEPLNVRAGDTFNIPEGYAHQLFKLGNCPLRILFACPDRHLEDDRHLLEDSG